LLALRDPAARAWLQAQSRDRILNDGQSDSALLIKILDADLRAGEAASINAWLETLETSEGAMVSGIIERDEQRKRMAAKKGKRGTSNHQVPEDHVQRQGKVLAEWYWRGLERLALLHDLEVRKARLKATDLTLEEQSKINAEFLELLRQI